jgi:hypothetical protein
MRRTRTGVRWFGAALLAFVGCTMSEPNGKPPLHEVWNLPPGDDARFSSPPAFPKETLNQDTIRKDPNAQPGAAFKGPSRGGVSGGMGGGY